MGGEHALSIPRWILLGAAAMIVLTLGLAAASRHGLIARAAPASAREAVQVRFEDRADGAIVMRDAATGREVSVVAPRSNGFVRGVLRGMFRTRKLESMANDAPFILARGVDGRLSIEDPLTRRRIDLDSFGPTNSAAFAELLVAARCERASAVWRAPDGFLSGARRRPVSERSDSQ